MSQVDKKEIMIKIRDLEESHCKGCKMLKNWREDLGNNQAYQKCMTDCRIGKKLHRLGDVLTFGAPVRKARDLTEELYLEERDQGLNDLQICEKHGISESQLRRRKQHWGIKLCHEKWTKLPLSRYKKYRDDGISDELICRLIGWDRKTLHKFKEKHGLIGKIKPTHHVTHTQDGKEITVDLYLQDLQIYKSDAAVARAWDVNISTFERIKRRWRESGQLDGQGESHGSQSESTDIF